MDQTINGSVSIESLTVSKLYVKKVNGIPMEEVYYKNKPQQIKGVKTFKYLNADEFNLTSINKVICLLFIFNYRDGFRTGPRRGGNLLCSKRGLIVFH